MNFTPILQKYKQHLQTTRLKDELYKWQLVEQFKGRPDVNAPDFAEEYKRVKFGNLVYQLTTGVGNHINKEQPEAFRKLFIALYDETIDLKERIDRFNKGALNLYREIGMDKGHHQDERAISAYLTFHNPEQYTFYKSSYYRAYCTDLGIKPQSSGAKYIHYLSLLNELIETQLKKDQELEDLVSAILAEHKLPFSWLLLAQDILYFTYESNPKEQNDAILDLKNAFATWLVNNPKADYFDNDKQRILNELTGYEDYFDFPLYETNKSKYQHLISDIEEVIYAEDNSPFVQYSERTSSHRPRAILGRRNYFKFLEDYFFEEELSFIRFIRDFDQQDLSTYFSFLIRIIKTFDLKLGDERLTFNYYDNRIVLTIGQRYVWCLKRDEPNETFAALSLSPISATGEYFEGADPKPFYNKFSSFDLSDEQLQSILDGIETEMKRSKKSGYRKNNHKADFEAYAFNLLAKANMKTPLNQILYGPPGTGKTHRLKTDYFPKYTTKETAISEEQYLDEVLRDLPWWKVIGMVVIREGKCKVGDILRHPWIIQKAKLSNSNTVRPTIWGQLQSHTIASCEHVNVQRKLSPYIFNKSADSFWEVIEEEAKEFAPELYELIEELSDFTPNPDKEIKRYVFTTFHQSFSYEDFIEGIKPLMDDESNEMSYAIQDGIFKELCKRAENDPENQYALFIDEINRGNVSAIFGELITLIETDKRKDGEHPMSATLPYSKKTFTVPSNVDIIGTMNTADRSVEALDTALRRRFSFVEMLPKPSLLENRDVNGIDLTALLTIMNQRIEALVDRDHTIGHAYFMKVETLEDLKTTFYKNIIPLLQEYFYGNYAKMAMVLGEAFFHDQSTNKVTFAYRGEDYYDDSKKVFKLKNEVEMVDFENAIKKLIGPKQAPAQ